jgi:hypothetical protein
MNITLSTNLERIFDSNFKLITGLLQGEEVLKLDPNASVQKIHDMNVYMTNLIFANYFLKILVEDYQKKQLTFPSLAVCETEQQFSERMLELKSSLESISEVSSKAFRVPASVIRYLYQSDHVKEVLTNNEIISSLNITLKLLENCEDNTALQYWTLNGLALNGLHSLTLIKKTNNNVDNFLEAFLNVEQSPIHSMSKEAAEYYTTKVRTLMNEMFELASLIGDPNDETSDFDALLVTLAKYTDVLIDTASDAAGNLDLPINLGEWPISSFEDIINANKTVNFSRRNALDEQKLQKFMENSDLSKRLLALTITDFNIAEFTELLTSVTQLIDKLPVTSKGKIESFGIIVKTFAELKAAVDNSTVENDELFIKQQTVASEVVNIIEKIIQLGFDAFSLTTVKEDNSLNNEEFIKKANNSARIPMNEETFIKMLAFISSGKTNALLVSSDFVGNLGASENLAVKIEAIRNAKNANKSSANESIKDLLNDLKKVRGEVNKEE